MKTIFDNKNLYIAEFYGQVINLRHDSHMEIKGNRNFAGSGGNFEVRSTTITYQQFFIQNRKGREENFQLVNWHVPMREGHHVKILYLFSKTKGYGFVAGIKNEELGTIHWNEKKIGNATLQKFSVLIKISLFFLLIAVIGFFGDQNPDNRFYITSGLIITASISLFLIYKWIKYLLSLYRILNKLM